MRILATAILLTLSSASGVLAESRVEESVARGTLIDRALGQLGELVVLESDVQNCIKCRSFKGQNCAIFVHLMQLLDSLPKRTQKMLEETEKEAAHLEQIIRRAGLNFQGAKRPGVEPDMLARIFLLSKAILLKESRERIDVAKVSQLVPGDIFKPRDDLKIQLKVFSVEKEDDLRDFYQRPWSEIEKKQHETLQTFREAELDGVVWKAVGALAPKACSAPLVSADNVIKVFCVTERDRNLNITDFPPDVVNMAVLNLAVNTVLEEPERYCGLALKELGFEALN